MPIYSKNKKQQFVYYCDKNLKYKKIGKIYKGNTLVYQSGVNITFVVDTNLIYTERFNIGSSILEPTSFTPIKSGWTFVGWRKDSVATDTVLHSEIASNIPTTLYAVFKQEVTCTFKSYNNTQYSSGTRYYNNGNVHNANVTVPNGAYMSGWSWRGWSNSVGATDGVYVNNGNIISNLASSITCYGLYQCTRTLYYNGNGNTGGSMGSTRGTAYYNASGNQVNPTVTVASCGYSKTAYGFSGWSINGITHYPGRGVTLNSTSVTAYALWSATNGAQIWSGTIEPYGTSELEMPIYCGSHDLSGFNYLRLWLKMKNPNVSGTVYVYINGVEVKRYSYLQFSNSETLDDLELINVSGYGANSTITISRSGHDHSTEINGSLYLYTAAPY